MVNYIGKDEEAFKIIMKDPNPHDSIEEHLKGSGFLIEWIIEVNEKKYPKLDKEYYGFWITDQFVWDSVHSMIDEGPVELRRVEKKEKVVTTTERVIVK